MAVADTMNLAEFPYESTDSDQISKTDAKFHHKMEAITKISVLTKTKLAMATILDFRKGSQPNRGLTYLAQIWWTAANCHIETIK